MKTNGGHRVLMSAPTARRPCEPPPSDAPFQAVCEGSMLHRLDCPDIFATHNISAPPLDSCRPPGRPRRGQAGWPGKPPPRGASGSSSIRDVLGQVVDLHTQCGTKALAACPASGRRRQGAGPQTALLRCGDAHLRPLEGNRILKRQWQQRGHPNKEHAAKCLARPASPAPTLS